MKVTKIRTALAALVAVGVIAAPGATGVASAAAADPLLTQSLEPSAQTAQLSTSDPRLPAVEGYTSAVVNGGSTGDGPADEEECERNADDINELIGFALHELYAGNMPGAAWWFTQAVTFVNHAENQGCIIE